eukprot:876187_1
MSSNSTYGRDTTSQQTMFSLRKTLSRNLQFTSDIGLAKNALAGMGLSVMLTIGVFLVARGLWHFHWTDPVSTGLIFGLYITALGIFHISEFFVTAVFHPKTLGFSAWIISHSRAFTLAYVLCFTEFWIEWMIFPSFKRRTWFLSFAGLCVTVGGQYMRTMAMWTAGSNFTHLVAMSKAPEHTLVTDGIYR